MASKQTPKTVTGELVYVAPAKLVMKDQVRTEVNEKDDKELLESVKVHGILQPIIARKVGGDLVVIAGHRRTTAALAAELKSIPVYVTSVEDSEVTARQLVENLQRSDMSLADTADAVWNLYNDAANGVAKVVGEMIGKPKSWVSKMLLLSAPGKAHSVARSLMARDKLHDIELAYLICQLEELDKAAAQEVGENIEKETRATVKARIAALESRKPAKPEGDGEGGDGDGEGNGDGEGDDSDAFTVEVLTFLQKVVTEATVQPSDMPAKKASLAAIRAMLAKQ